MRKILTLKTLLIAVLCFALFAFIACDRGGSQGGDTPGGSDDPSPTPQETITRTVYVYNGSSVFKDTYADQAELNLVAEDVSGKVFVCWTINSEVFSFEKEIDFLVDKNAVIHAVYSTDSVITLDAYPGEMEVPSAMYVLKGENRNRREKATVLYRINGTPEIEGRIAAGEKVVAYTDSLNGGCTTFSYQWESSADGTAFLPIEGATEKEYTIGEEQVSYYLRVAVTGTGVYYGTEYSLPTEGTVLKAAAASEADLLEASGTQGNGLIREARVSVVTGSAFRLAVPFAENKTFLGWYDGETQVTDEKGEYIADAPVGTTLRAKFRENKKTTIGLYKLNPESGVATLSLTSEKDYFLETKYLDVLAENIEDRKCVGWYPLTFLPQGSEQPADWQEKYGTYYVKSGNVYVLNDSATWDKRNDYAFCGTLLEADTLTRLEILFSDEDDGKHYAYVAAYQEAYRINVGGGEGSSDYQGQDTVSIAAIETIGKTFDKWTFVNGTDGKTYLLALAGEKLAIVDEDGNVTYDKAGTVVTERVSYEAAPAALSFVLNDLQKLGVDIGGNFRIQAKFISEIYTLTYELNANVNGNNIFENVGNLTEQDGKRTVSFGGYTFVDVKDKNGYDNIYTCVLEMQYNQSINLLPSLAVDHYEFDSWQPQQGGTIPSTMPQDALTLVGTYHAERFAISVSAGANGDARIGSRAGVTNGLYDYHSTITIYVTATKGYVFDGWTYDAQNLSLEEKKDGDKYIISLKEEPLYGDVVLYEYNYYVTGVSQDEPDKRITANFTERAYNIEYRYHVLYDNEDVTGSGNYFQEYVYVTVPVVDGVTTYREINEELQARALQYTCSASGTVDWSALAKISVNGKTFAKVPAESNGDVRFVLLTEGSDEEERFLVKSSLYLSYGDGYLVLHLSTGDTYETVETFLQATQQSATVIADDKDAAVLWNYAETVTIGGTAYKRIMVSDNGKKGYVLCLVDDLNKADTLPACEIDTEIGGYLVKFQAYAVVTFSKNTVTYEDINILLHLENYPQKCAETDVGAVVTGNIVNIDGKEYIAVLLNDGRYVLYDKSSSSESCFKWVEGTLQEGYLLKTLYFSVASAPEYRYMTVTVGEQGTVADVCALLTKYGYACSPVGNETSLCRDGEWSTLRVQNEDFGIDETRYYRIAVRYNGDEIYVLVKISDDEAGTVTWVESEQKENDLISQKAYAVTAVEQKRYNATAGDYRSTQNLLRQFLPYELSLLYTADREASSVWQVGEWQTSIKDIASTTGGFRMLMQDIRAEYDITIRSYQMKLSYTKEHTASHVILSINGRDASCYPRSDDAYYTVPYGSAVSTFFNTNEGYQYNFMAAMDAVVPFTVRSGEEYQFYVDFSFATAGKTVVEYRSSRNSHQFELFIGFDSENETPKDILIEALGLDLDKTVTYGDYTYYFYRYYNNDNLNHLCEYDAELTLRNLAETAQYETVFDDCHYDHPSGIWTTVYMDSLTPCTVSKMPDRDLYGLALLTVEKNKVQIKPDGTGTWIFNEENDEMDIRLLSGEYSGTPRVVGNETVYTTDYFTEYVFGYVLPTGHNFDRWSVSLYKEGSSSSVSYNLDKRVWYTGYRYLTVPLTDDMRTRWNEIKRNYYYRTVDGYIAYKDDDVAPKDDVVYQQVFCTYNEKPTDWLTDYAEYSLMTFTQCTVNTEYKSNKEFWQKYYLPLDGEPADWATNYGAYFVKEDDSYVAVIDGVFDASVTYYYEGFRKVNVSKEVFNANKENYYEGSVSTYLYTLETVFNDTLGYDVTLLHLFVRSNVSVKANFVKEEKTATVFIGAIAEPKSGTLLATWDKKKSDAAASVRMAKSGNADSGNYTEPETNRLKFEYGSAVRLSLDSAKIPNGQKLVGIRVYKARTDTFDETYGEADLLDAFSADAEDDVKKIILGSNYVYSTEEFYLTDGTYKNPNMIRDDVFVVLYFELILYKVNYYLYTGINDFESDSLSQSTLLRSNQATERKFGMYYYDYYEKSRQGSYALLNEEPEDWSSAWENYYTKKNGIYVRLTDETAPVWQESTYYYSDMLQKEEVFGLLSEEEIASFSADGVDSLLFVGWFRNKMDMSFLDGTQVGTYNHTTGSKDISVYGALVNLYTFSSLAEDTCAVAFNSFLQSNFPTWYGETLEKLILPSKNGSQTVVQYGYKENESNKGFADNGKIKTLLIPAQVNNIAAAAFSGCTELTELLFEEGVQEIADDAFAGCSKLEDVDFPASLLTIGKRAFSGTSFDTIKIVDTLRNIGESAFGGQLKEHFTVYYDGIDSDYCYLPGFGLVNYQGIFGCASNSATVSYVIGKKVQTFYKGATKGIVEKITSLTIEEGGAYLSILIDSFKNSALTSVTIGSRVIAMQESVFAASPYLQEVTFEADCSVTTVPNRCFADCHALRTVTLAEKTTTIGKEAFNGDESLTTVYYRYYKKDGDYALINNKKFIYLTTIGENAFDGTALDTFTDTDETYEGIYFPYSGKYEQGDYSLNTLQIQAYAFARNNASLITFASYAIEMTKNINNQFLQFFNSVSLETICYDMNVAAWEDASSVFTFGSGSNVHVVIADTVTTVPNNLFSGLQKVSEITLGKGLTSVGNKAFYGITTLRTIRYNCVKAVTVPTAANACFGNSGSTKGTKFIVGEGVSSLPKQICYGATYITEADFEGAASTFTIGENAFYQQRIATVTFEDTSVETLTIEKGAFYDEDAATKNYFENVVLPDTITTLTVSPNSFAYDATYSVFTVAGITQTNTVLPVRVDEGVLIFRKVDDSFDAEVPTASRISVVTPLVLQKTEGVCNRLLVGGTVDLNNDMTVYGNVVMQAGGSVEYGTYFLNGMVTNWGEFDERIAKGKAYNKVTFDNDIDLYDIRTLNTSNPSLYNANVIEIEFKGLTVKSGASLTIQQKVVCTDSVVAETGSTLIGGKENLYLGTQTVTVQSGSVLVLDNKTYFADGAKTVGFCLSSDDFVTLTAKSTTDNLTKGLTFTVEGDMRTLAGMTLSDKEDLCVKNGAVEIAHVSSFGTFTLDEGTVTVDENQYFSYIYQTDYDAEITAGAYILRSNLSYYFDTFNLAASLAEAGETIKVLCSQNIERFTVSKTISVNMNNKTLTFAKDTEQDNVITVGGTVTLTISTGTIIVDAPLQDDASLLRQTAGRLVLQNVTLTAEQGGTLLNIPTGQQFSMSGCTLTTEDTAVRTGMDGAEIDTSKITAGNGIYVKGGSLTMQDTSIYAQYYALYTDEESRSGVTILAQADTKNTEFSSEKGTVVYLENTQQNSQSFTFEGLNTHTLTIFGYDAGIRIRTGHLILQGKVVLATAVSRASADAVQTGTVIVEEKASWTASTYYDDTFTVLTEKPDDWDENWESYYIHQQTYTSLRGETQKPVWSSGLYTLGQYTLSKDKTRPSNWSTAYVQYYKKEQNEYVSLAGGSAPTWEVATFYLFEEGSLLQDRPSDWSYNWKAYLKKTGDGYTFLDGTQAPTWASNTYYSPYFTQVSENDWSAMTAWKEAYIVSQYRHPYRMVGENVSVSATSTVGISNSAERGDCIMHDSTSVTESGLTYSINKSAVQGVYAECSRVMNGTPIVHNKYGLTIFVQKNVSSSQTEQVMYYTAILAALQKVRTGEKITSDGCTVSQAVSLPADVLWIVDGSVTLKAAMTIAGTLTISGSLTAQAAMTITDTAVMEIGGTFYVRNTVQQDGSLTVDELILTASFTGSGDVSANSMQTNANGSLTMQTGSTLSFRNLSVASGTSVVSYASVTTNGKTTNNGTLEIYNKWKGIGNNATVSDNGTMTLGGTADVSVYKIDMNTTASLTVGSGTTVTTETMTTGSNGTLTINGTLRLTKSAISSNPHILTGTIQIGGVLEASGYVKNQATVTVSGTIDTLYFVNEADITVTTGTASWYQVINGGDILVDKNGSIAVTDTILNQAKGSFVLLSEASENRIGKVLLNTVSNDNENYCYAVLPEQDGNGDPYTVEYNCTLRYVVLEEEPADWATGYGAYYVRKHIDTVDAPTWATRMYYQEAYTLLYKDPEPSEWGVSYQKYYKKVGDGYVPLTPSDAWENGVYYSKSYELLIDKPEDWETDWTEYYYKDTFERVSAETDWIGGTFFTDRNVKSKVQVTLQSVPQSLYLYSFYDAREKMTVLTANCSRMAYSYSEYSVSYSFTATDGTYQCTVTENGKNGLHWNVGDVYGAHDVSYTSDGSEWIGTHSGICTVCSTPFIEQHSYTDEIVMTSVGGKTLLARQCTQCGGAYMVYESEALAKVSDLKNYVKERTETAVSLGSANSWDDNYLLATGIQLVDTMTETLPSGSVTYYLIQTNYGNGYVLVHFDHTSQTVDDNNGLTHAVVWDDIFVEKHAKHSVTISAENVVQVNAKPSDFASKYNSSYYLLTGKTANEDTRWHIAEIYLDATDTVLTAKPSDWDTNYASYFIATVEKNTSNVWDETKTYFTGEITKLNSKPEDWDDTGAYLYYYRKSGSNYQKLSSKTTWSSLSTYGYMKYTEVAKSNVLCGTCSVCSYGTTSDPLVYKYDASTKVSDIVGYLTLGSFTGMSSTSSVSSKVSSYKQYNGYCLIPVANKSSVEYYVLGESAAHQYAYVHTSLTSRQHTKVCVTCSAASTQEDHVPDTMPVGFETMNVQKNGLPVYENFLCTTCTVCSGKIIFVKTFTDDMTYQEISDALEAYGYRCDYADMTALVQHDGGNIFKAGSDTYYKIKIVSTTDATKKGNLLISIDHKWILSDKWNLDYHTFACEMDDAEIRWIAHDWTGASVESEAVTVQSVTYNVLGKRCVDCGNLVYLYQNAEHTITLSNLDTLLSAYGLSVVYGGDKKTTKLWYYIYQNRYRIQTCAAHIGLNDVENEYYPVKVSGYGEGDYYILVHVNDYTINYREYSNTDEKFARMFSYTHEGSCEHNNCMDIESAHTLSTVIEIDEGNYSAYLPSGNYLVRTCSDCGQNVFVTYLANDNTTYQDVDAYLDGFGYETIEGGSENRVAYSVFHDKSEYPNHIQNNDAFADYWLLPIQSQDGTKTASLLIRFRHSFRVETENGDNGYNDIYTCTECGYTYTERHLYELTEKYHQIEAINELTGEVTVEEKILNSTVIFDQEVKKEEYSISEDKTYTWVEKSNVIPVYFFNADTTLDDVTGFFIGVDQWDQTADSYLASGYVCLPFNENVSVLESGIERIIYKEEVYYYIPLYRMQLSNVIFDGGEISDATIINNLEASPSLYLLAKFDSAVDDQGVFRVYDEENDGWKTLKKNQYIDQYGEGLQSGQLMVEHTAFASTAGKENKVFAAETCEADEEDEIIIYHIREKTTTSELNQYFISKNADAVWADEENGILTVNGYMTYYDGKIVDLLTYYTNVGDLTEWYYIPMYSIFGQVKVNADGTFTPCVFTLGNTEDTYDSVISSYPVFYVLAKLEKTPVAEENRFTFVCGESITLPLYSDSIATSPMPAASPKEQTTLSMDNTKDDMMVLCQIHCDVCVDYNDLIVTINATTTFDDITQYFMGVDYWGEDLGGAGVSARGFYCHSLFNARSCMSIQNYGNKIGSELKTYTREGKTYYLLPMYSFMATLRFEAGEMVGYEWTSKSIQPSFYLLAEYDETAQKTVSFQTDCGRQLSLSPFSVLKPYIKLASASTTTVEIDLLTEYCEDVRKPVVFHYNDETTVEQVLKYFIGATELSLSEESFAVDIEDTENADGIWYHAEGYTFIRSASTLKKYLDLPFARYLEEISSKWCSEMKSRTISGYNNSVVKVQYDECNPFAVMAGDFGDMEELSGQNKVTPTAVENAMNLLSEKAAGCLEKSKSGGEIPSVFQISTAGTEQKKAFDDTYKQAVAAYIQNTKLAIARVDETDLCEEGMLIGINQSFTIGYTVSGSVNYQGVVAKLFGFNTASDFVNCAQSLADSFLQADFVALGNPLAYDGIATQNGTYVFPIVVQNEYTPRVLTCVFLDAKGLVYVWISNISSAMKAIQYDSDHYTDADIINNLYCKTLLFVEDTSLGDFVNKNKYNGESCYFVPLYAVVDANLYLMDRKIVAEYSSLGAMKTNMPAMYFVARYDTTLSDSNGYFYCDEYDKSCAGTGYAFGSDADVGMSDAVTVSSKIGSDVTEVTAKNGDKYYLIKMSKSTGEYYTARGNSLTIKEGMVYTQDYVYLIGVLDNTATQMQFTVKSLSEQAVESVYDIAAFGQEGKHLESQSFFVGNAYSVSASMKNVMMVSVEGESKVLYCTFNDETTLAEISRYFVGLELWYENDNPNIRSSVVRPVQDVDMGRLTKTYLNEEVFAYEHDMGSYTTSTEVLYLYDEDTLWSDLNQALVTALSKNTEYDVPVSASGFLAGGIFGQGNIQDNLYDYPISVRGSQEYLLIPLYSYQGTVVFTDDSVYENEAGTVGSTKLCYLLARKVETGGNTFVFLENDAMTGEETLSPFDITTIEYDSVKKQYLFVNNLVTLRDDIGGQKSTMVYHYTDKTTFEELNRFLIGAKTWNMLAENVYQAEGYIAGEIDRMTNRISSKYTATVGGTSYTLIPLYSFKGTVNTASGKLSITIRDSLSTEAVGYLLATLDASKHLSSEGVLCSQTGTYYSYISNVCQKKTLDFSVKENISSFGHVLKAETATDLDVFQYTSEITLRDINRMFIGKDYMVITDYGEHQEMLPDEETQMILGIETRRTVQVKGYIAFGSLDPSLNSKTISSLSSELEEYTYKGITYKVVPLVAVEGTVVIDGRVEELFYMDTSRFVSYDLHYTNVPTKYLLIDEISPLTRCFIGARHEYSYLGKQPYDIFRIKMKQDVNGPITESFDTDVPSTTWTMKPGVVEETLNTQLAITGSRYLYVGGKRATYTITQETTFGDIDAYFLSVPALQNVTCLIMGIDATDTVFDWLRSYGESVVLTEGTYAIPVSLLRGEQNVGWQANLEIIVQEGSFSEISGVIDSKDIEVSADALLRMPCTCTETETVVAHISKNTTMNEISQYFIGTSRWTYYGVSEDYDAYKASGYIAGKKMDTRTVCSQAIQVKDVSGTYYLIPMYAYEDAVIAIDMRFVVKPTFSDTPAFYLLAVVDQPSGMYFSNDCGTVEMTAYTYGAFVENKKLTTKTLTDADEEQKSYLTDGNYNPVILHYTSTTVLNDLNEYLVGAKGWSYIDDTTYQATGLLVGMAEYGASTALITVAEMAEPVVIGTDNYLRVPLYTIANGSISLTSHSVVENTGLIDTDIAMYLLMEVSAGSETGFYTENGKLSLDSYFSATHVAKTLYGNGGKTFETKKSAVVDNMACLTMAYRVNIDTTLGDLDDDFRWKGYTYLHDGTLQDDDLVFYLIATHRLPDGSFYIPMASEREEDVWVFNLIIELNVSIRYLAEEDSPLDHDAFFIASYCQGCGKSSLTEKQAYNVKEKSFGGLNELRDAYAGTLDFSEKDWDESYSAALLAQNGINEKIENVLLENVMQKGKTVLQPAEGLIDGLVGSYLLKLGTKDGKPVYLVVIIA